MSRDERLTAFQTTVEKVGRDVLKPGSLPLEQLTSLRLRLVAELQNIFTVLESMVIQGSLKESEWSNAWRTRTERVFWAFGLVQTPPQLQYKPTEERQTWHDRVLDRTLAGVRDPAITKDLVVRIYDTFGYRDMVDAFIDVKTATSVYPSGSWEQMWALRPPGGVANIGRLMFMTDLDDFVQASGLQKAILDHARSGGKYEVGDLLGPVLETWLMQQSTIIQAYAPPADQERVSTWLADIVANYANLQWLDPGQGNLPALVEQGKIRQAQAYINTKVFSDLRDIHDMLIRVINDCRAGPETNPLLTESERVAALGRGVTITPEDAEKYKWILWERAASQSDAIHALWDAIRPWYSKTSVWESFFGSVLAVRSLRAAITATTHPLIRAAKFFEKEADIQILMSKMPIGIGQEIHFEFDARRFEEIAQEFREEYAFVAQKIPFLTKLGGAVSRIMPIAWLIWLIGSNSMLWDLAIVDRWRTAGEKVIDDFVKQNIGRTFSSYREFEAAAAPIVQAAVAQINAISLDIARNLPGTPSTAGYFQTPSLATGPDDHVLIDKNVIYSAMSYLAPYTEFLITPVVHALASTTYVKEDQRESVARLAIQQVLSEVSASLFRYAGQRTSAAKLLEWMEALKRPGAPLSINYVVDKATRIANEAGPTMFWGVSLAEEMKRIPDAALVDYGLIPGVHKPRPKEEDPQKSPIWEQALKEARAIAESKVEWIMYRHRLPPALLSDLREQAYKVVEEELKRFLLLPSVSFAYARDFRNQFAHWLDMNVWPHFESVVSAKP